MKAPGVLKTPKPTDPWIQPADVRHDMVVTLGCPAYYQGKLEYVTIQFLAEELLERMKHTGGGLVVKLELIRDLTDLFLLSCELVGRAPPELSHTDYPFTRFRVMREASLRMLSDPVLGPRVVPGPVRFLTFWAVPRQIKVEKINARSSN